MRSTLVKFESCRWANGDHCNHRDNETTLCWEYDYKECKHAKEYYQSLSESAKTEVKNT